MSLKIKYTSSPKLFYIMQIKLIYIYICYIYVHIYVYTEYSN